MICTNFILFSLFFVKIRYFFRIYQIFFAKTIEFYLNLLYYYIEKAVTTIQRH